MERRNVASGAARESEVGYSRAVRIGSHVSVAGTIAPGPYARLGSAEEAYRQAKAALEIVARSLGEAGARLDDVIRTRLFVVRIDRDGRAVGRAHAEVFGKIRPVTTMVEVSRLIDPKQLVEIEADAVVREVVRERR